MSAPSTKKVKTYKPAFDHIPEEGHVMEIAPRFFWLRMPLSFELSHINLWLMQSRTGDWTLVDAGFNTPETLKGWDRAFADNVAGNKVEKIFITHFHPDHFGLAGDLHRRTKAPVFMTTGEWAVVNKLTGKNSLSELEELYTPYYIAAGVPADLMMKMLDKRKLYQKIISTPPAITEMSLGDHISLGGRDWLLIGGGGHTPEHAGLYDAAGKIFIAGDLVLPDITPNISFFPGNAQDHDPLQDYYDTLHRIKAAVSDDVLVLPSHGIPFYGLHRRIDEIIAHHEARCKKIRSICADIPKSGYEVMQELFAHRHLSVSDLFFALSETLAHLVHDLRKGLIQISVHDGIDRFTAK